MLHLPPRKYHKGLRVHAPAGPPPRAQTVEAAFSGTLCA